ncbi:MAG TPA: DUF1697 domain-containing protein [Vicinamibacteria bacterium]|nr:DUF1697 domain-containing protein [Vicinamibacteria bacterium]
MGHVVFLRAANVGGRNVFRPAELVRELRHLDVVNVGAAGTFVVRGKATAAAVRREILARLPFEPGLAVVPGKDVLALVDGRPFARVTLSKDLRGWVAVLDGPPKSRPTLPIAVPAGKAWSVRFERLDVPFALGLWQRRPRGFVFPNEVVEKTLGVRATTRYWETVERTAEILRRSGG